MYILALLKNITDVFWKEDERSEIKKFRSFLISI